MRQVPRAAGPGPAQSRYVATLTGLVSSWAQDVEPLTRGVPVRTDASRRLNVTKRVVTGASPQLSTSGHKMLEIDVHLSNGEVRKELISSMQKVAGEWTPYANVGDVLPGNGYRMASQVAEDLDKVQLKWDRSAEGVGKIAEEVAHDVDAFSGAEQARLYGIPNAAIISPATVKAFRKTNVGLVKSLAGDQKNRLSKILEDAETSGQRVEETSRQIAEAFDIAKRHAELIAVDQTLTLNAQIVQDRQKAAGIERYTWKTSEDERVRPEHADLDGTEHSWDDPPEFEDGTRGHPGEPIRCRCQAVPVLSWLDDE